MKNKYKTLGLLLLIISPLAMSENYIIGQLVPVRSVTISNEIIGVVDQYNKDIGDNVSKGEVLVKLSVEDNLLNVQLVKAELAVSQNELEIQEKQLKRYKTLYDNKGISASQYDEQRRITNANKAQVEVDKVKLAIAKKEQDKSQVKAPFSGLILTRNVELGQFILASDPLYTLVDISKIKVRFYLLESDVVSTHVGDLATVTIPSLDKTFTGTVAIVAPAFEQTKIGFLVEVLLDNPINELKSGMLARIKLSE
jgi:RND family efflux transporter MFP subunit